MCSTLVFSFFVRHHWSTTVNVYFLLSLIQHQKSQYYQIPSHKLTKQETFCTLVFVLDVVHTVKFKWQAQSQVSLYHDRRMKGKAFFAHLLLFLFFSVKTVKNGKWIFWLFQKK